MQIFCIIKISGKILNFIVQLYKSADIWIHILPNGILYLQYSTVYLFSCLRKCRYSVDLCILLLTSEYMHRPYLRIFHGPHDSVELKEDFLKETVSQDRFFYFSFYHHFSSSGSLGTTFRMFSLKTAKIFNSQGWLPVSNDTIAKFPYFGIKSTMA